MTDKSKEQRVKAQVKSATETAREGALNTGLAAPSEKDVKEARNEGITESIKEQAKESYEYATDGQLPGEPADQRFLGSSQHTNMIDGLLALGVDELKERIDPKADDLLSEDQVANLLKLERAGPNRTDHVKALCKRLDIKSPYEVTMAGPPYTNDQTNVTEL